jgi:hypothetical protein
MNWFSGFFKSKSSADIEAEKTAEIAKLSQSYDEKIAAAKAKESAAAPPAEGTASLTGARRKKTRRGKKKGKKSRKH